MRLTIACPEAHRADANALAMVLGYGPCDAATFGGAGWQDGLGGRYAAASLIPDSGDFTARALGATLARPEWDVEPYAVNMAGALRAQALLVLGQPGDLADPARILATPGDDGPAALAAMGLTPVPEAMGG